MGFNSAFKGLMTKSLECLSNVAASNGG